MGMQITQQESHALYGLLAESSSDIVLKTDRDGFIVHATPAIERLGLLPPDMLIWPHILDLVDDTHVAAIAAAHSAAISGKGQGARVEFLAKGNGESERWFEIQLRSLIDHRNRIYGALGIMRSIDDLRRLEDSLFTATMTDALTGLTNRRAFVCMLEHLVRDETQGCLALFDINRFKAINIAHGQSFGDKVLVVFSDLLRTLMRRSDIISRIGSESFAVILPDTSIDEAREACGRLIDTLSEVGERTRSGKVVITASAGVALIGGSLDATLRRAEIAAFLARTRRGCGLEVDLQAP
ncbi:MAG: GGDEF domain-containing protein [Novosphingobium sp.]|nr:GGDEF domain-containing protein [Novosphingobium sp.]